MRRHDIEALLLVVRDGAASDGGDLVDEVAAGAPAVRERPPECLGHRHALEMCSHAKTKDDWTMPVAARDIDDFQWGASCWTSPLLTLFSS